MKVGASNDSKAIHALVSGKSSPIPKTDGLEWVSLCGAFKVESSSERKIGDIDEKDYLESHYQSTQDVTGVVCLNCLRKLKFGKIPSR